MRLSKPNCFRLIYLLKKPTATLLLSLYLMIRRQSEDNLKEIGTVNR